jgi:hypothetical protein
MASLEFGLFKQSYFRITFFTNILKAIKDYVVAKNFKTGTLIACKKGNYRSVKKVISSV